MAATPGSRRPVRRFGFGRREKLVIIGALGLVSIGALHFVIFNPRSNALRRVEQDYQRVKSEYENLTGENYPEREIERYRARTVDFREELYRIVARADIALQFPDEAREREGFRERVKRLTRKWYDLNADPSVTTDLVFVRRQPIASVNDLNNVAQGRYLWNLPDSLPETATDSVIKDNLRQARGKYRLIQRLGNDPTGRRSLQQQLNQLLRELGIEPFLVGADRVSFPQAWEQYRLPVPLNYFCAIAHIELLLDRTYPSPFAGDPGLMERGRANPESLTDEQRERYQQWVESREAERQGNPQIVGLEEIFDIEYEALEFLIYNRTLDHIERLVDMAIDAGVSTVRMVKLKEYEDITPPEDPWEIPEEEEVPEEPTAPSGPEAPAQYYGEEYAYALAGVEEGYLNEQALYYGIGGYTPQAQAQVVAEPQEPPFASVTPVYMQITGEYSRVWQFILRVTTGPYLYSVEELSIYTHGPNGLPVPNLPEGEIAADVWISVPIYVQSVDVETGLAAEELAAAYEEEPTEDMAEMRVEPAAAEATTETAGEPAGTTAVPGV